MRDKIKGAVLGALVALGATVLLAQTPPWTAPITWTTGDLLTASQFNAQFRDNLLNLRAFSACADSGISGTASADTVLFGDCRWDDIPATTVVALDMGSTTTTASTYQTVGPTASIGVAPGQAVTIYVSGGYRLDATCNMRLRNTTTAIDLFETTLGVNYFTNELTAASFEDTSPSSTSDNTYALQISRVTAPGTCQWLPPVPFSINIPGAENNRGFIVVVS